MNASMLRSRGGGIKVSSRRGSVFENRGVGGRERTSVECAGRSEKSAGKAGTTNLSERGENTTTELRRRTCERTASQLRRLSSRRRMAESRLVREYDRCSEAVQGPRPGRVQTSCVVGCACRRWPRRQLNENDQTYEEFASMQDTSMNVTRRRWRLPRTARGTLRGRGWLVGRPVAPPGILRAV